MMWQGVVRISAKVFGRDEFSLLLEMNLRFQITVSIRLKSFSERLCERVPLHLRGR